MSTNKERIIEAFLDPAVGLVSAESLHKKLKAEKITLREIKETLANLDVVQRFKRKTKKEYFPITHPNGRAYQADITFLSNLAKKNSGYGDILTVVNVMSRYGYAIPMKTKSAKEVAAALSVVIEDAEERGFPMHDLTTDNGTEFLNSDVEKLLAKHGVIHNTNVAGDHNTMGKIERFNKTIRDRIARLLRVKGGSRWIDDIESLIDNYNNTVHSSIKMEPSKVDENLISKLSAKDVKRTRDLLRKFNFKEGDVVRKQKQTKLFKKDETRYSKKLFTVVRVGKYSIHLDDGTKERPYNLLLVNKADLVRAENMRVPVVATEVSVPRKETIRADKVERLNKAAGVSLENIIDAPRVRKPKVQF